MRSICFINPRDYLTLEPALDLPYHLLRAATAAKNAGMDVKIIDLNHDDEIPDDFDAYGITGVTCQHRAIINIAIDIRQRRPDALLILGGRHAPFIDEGIDLFDIIWTGKAEELFRAPERPVDYSLIDWRRYGREVDGRKSVIVMFSEGCPFSCNFCYNAYRDFRVIDRSCAEKELSQIDDDAAIFVADDFFSLKTHGHILDLLKGVDGGSCRMQRKSRETRRFSSNMAQNLSTSGRNPDRAICFTK